MKKINAAFCILFAILAIVFSTFSRYAEISEYDIVSGIALDKKEDKWFVTCEICSPSSDSDFGSKSIYVKAEGLTLKEALENAAAKSPNELYIDCAQLYLISDKLKGDASVRDFLKSDSINMRAVTVYTEADASDLFETKEYENERAKSIALVKKIKHYAASQGMPHPGVAEFIKSDSVISICADKTFERG